MKLLMGLVLAVILGLFPAQGLPVTFTLEHRFRTSRLTEVFEAVKAFDRHLGLPAWFANPNYHIPNNQSLRGVAFSTLLENGWYAASVAFQSQVADQEAQILGLSVRPLPSVWISSVDWNESVTELTTFQPRQTFKRDLDVSAVDHLRRIYESSAYYHFEISDPSTTHTIHLCPQSTADVQLVAQLLKSNPNYQLIAHCPDTNEPHLLGSYVTSLQLKNPEYKTINEAIAPESESKSMPQSKEGEDIDESTPTQSHKSDLTLLDVIKDEHLLERLGTSTLWYIYTQLKYLLTEDRPYEFKPINETGITAEGVRGIPSCLQGISEPEKLQPGELKLECLSDILTNMPEHLPEIAARWGAQKETIWKVSRAARNVRYLVGGRWNAVMVNDEVKTFASSSAQSSKAMRLGYVSEAVETLILPVTDTLDVLERSGVQGQDLDSILAGQTVSEAPEMNSTILSQIIEWGERGRRLGKRRVRWDYRSVTNYVVLVSPKDVPSTIAWDEGLLVSNLHDIITGAERRPPLSFRLNTAVISIDPTRLADWQNLRAVTELNDSGIEVRLIPWKDCSGALCRIFFGDTARPSRSRHASDRRVLRAFIAQLSRLPETKLQTMTDIEVYSIWTSMGGNGAVRRYELPKRVSAAPLLEPLSVAVNGYVIRVGLDTLPDQTIAFVLDLMFETIQDISAIILSRLYQTPLPPHFSRERGSVEGALSKVSDMRKLFKADREQKRSWLTPRERLVLQPIAAELGYDWDSESFSPSIDDFHLHYSSPFVSPEPQFAYDHVDKIIEIESNIADDSFNIHLLDSITLSKANELLSKGNATSDLYHEAILFYPAKEVPSKALRRKLIEVLDEEVPPTAYLLPYRVSLLPVDEQGWLVNERGRRVCFTGLSPTGGLWVDGLLATNLDWAAIETTNHSNALWLRLHSLLSNAEAMFRQHLIDCVESVRTTKKWKPFCPDMKLNESESKLRRNLIIQAIVRTGINRLQSNTDEELTATVNSVFEKASTSSLRIRAVKEGAPGSQIEIKAVIDPLSRFAQHVVPVLTYLHTYLNTSVVIVLNPAAAYKELPVNRYVRVVAASPDGSRPPLANWSSVQTNETLTAAVDAYPHWRIRGLEKAVDLDNLRKIELNADAQTTVRYLLSGLYIEGSSTNRLLPAEEREISVAADGSREGSLWQTAVFTEALGGNTLVLREPGSMEVVADTVTLKNFGYFQFPVDRPGLYHLALSNGEDRHDLRSFSSLVPSDPTVYQIAQNGSFWKTITQCDVEVAGLAPITMQTDFLTASRRAMRRDGAMDYLKGWMKGFWPGGGDVTDRQLPQPERVASYATDPEAIHIFSLATGHLYERLLRIMMTSVRTHTRSKLVFWILDNFLSAQFKENAKLLEEAYPNFEVRYVSYKWPPFLRAQSEKQRQIWAYKILFLDVLFPMSLDRIIYIDADQIVRADVKELWNMKLNGEVYGFTPFCKDRKETARFRFWESGYWASLLGDSLQYHISALFVVDLKRFRERQVGSELRMMYQSLSADPNSLANLDQDLPNFAQKSIPIFSLPQEWLWCETWCSDESKSRAKTIDLCNNPLTHEPKLTQAQRIVSEWKDYDKQVEAILQSQLHTKAERDEL